LDLIVRTVNIAWQMKIN